MLIVKIEAITNFTADEAKKLYESIKLLEKIVNSSEFRWKIKDDVLYKKFMSGAEESNGICDEKINLNITMYSKWFSKVIGYTYPGTNKTWFNRKYFTDLPTITANIAHEYCHHLGYSDTGNSKPYLISKVVREEALFELKKNI